MTVMTEHLHQAIIRAERAHQAAVEAHATAQKEADSIKVRLAEQDAAHEQIIANRQANAIDERAAALRFEVNKANTRDLAAMLLDAQNRAMTAVEQVKAAEHSLRMAQAALKHHEDQQTSAALDATINALQQKLVDAIRAKQQSDGVSPNVFYKVWKPLLALEDAVRGTK
jgi:hypothetical protein